MSVNTIQTAAVIQSELDKAAVEQATSGWMEVNSNLVKYNGGSEVKIPELILLFLQVTIKLVIGIKPLIQNLILFKCLYGIKQIRHLRSIETDFVIVVNLSYSYGTKDIWIRLLLCKQS